MFFDTRTALAGIALISQILAAPLLEERASLGIVTQLHIFVPTEFTHLN